MARVSVHIPAAVAEWLAEVSVRDKRSLSQAASVIIQEAYEESTPYYPSGISFADVVSGIEPPSTPLTDSIKRKKDSAK